MEICSCGGKMKVCQENLITGSECIICGKRVWNNYNDLVKAKSRFYIKKKRKKKQIVKGEPMEGSEQPPIETVFYTGEE